MSEYRTTATLTQDGTFVVHSPGGLPVGAEAEIIVRLPDSSKREARHPLEAFLDELRSRPVDPQGKGRAEAAQVFLRELREEWD